jgi:GT2 family glycosyltransferase
MLTPNCIDDSVKAIKEQGVDFIHGNAIEVTQSSGKMITKRPVITFPTFQNLLNKNTIHSATLMYKREVFERLGGFGESNKLKSFEEYEFNLRCLKAGVRIGYCNAPLAIYRRHPDQLIRTVDKIKRRQYRNELVNSYQW